MHRISQLATALALSPNTHEKLEHLNQDRLVSAFMQRPSVLRTCLATLPPECEMIIKSLIAIDQAERLFPKEGLEADQVRAVVRELLPIERFYREMGGLVGYHALLLRHLQKKTESQSTSSLYLRPEGVALFDLNDEVKKYVIAGIRALPSLAEIYPVGGAADRLRLQDPQTKLPLPAARLQFCGKTLIEWMLQDLQAREYLYFKLMHQQVIVPVAMMTSQEKDNHAQILALCEEKKWFGRPAGSFAFFCQPAVPTMDKEGNWGLLGPLKPLMKPGGHGVIWKLAKDQGIMDWLLDLGRKKMIVRQINNPIAGCDYGLLSFAGIGFELDKGFGFASCLRQVQAAEGVNVLIEKRVGDQKECCLTNIEYCDFEKYGIEDVPVHPNSCYSQFPSNTNILFADIAKICSAVVDCPIPGMIVNLKKMVVQDGLGGTREEELARLESTMQNIADCFVDRFAYSEKASELSTFLTYNHRHKTISTVKKEWAEGGAMLETPEGCYWDLYRNGRDLLENYCGFLLPKAGGENPSFDFSYHPALGPLYSIISQKLRRGKIAEGSQLDLSLAELDCENLELCGRLSICAEMPMGHLDGDGKLCYSDRAGRCKLSNVSVVNEGCVERSASASWRRETVSEPGCEIILQGDSEFEAINVTFSGNFRLEVEEGFRVVATEKEGKIQLKKQKLRGTSWCWEYQIDDQNAIQLKKRKAAD